MLVGEETLRASTTTNKLNSYIITPSPGYISERRVAVLNSTPSLLLSSNVKILPSDVKHIGRGFLRQATLKSLVAQLSSSLSL